MAVLCLPAYEMESVASGSAVVSGRFHITTSEEVNEVREKRLEPKTKEQTAWGVSIFCSWLQERGKHREFEVLSPTTTTKELGEL